MMNRLLAVGLALCSPVAFGAVKTCDLKDSPGLNSQFNNRSFDGFYRVNDKDIKTRVTLNGGSGFFTREGVSADGQLRCVRYLTIDAADALSQNGEGAGFAVYNYFDTSSCDVAIVAEWTIVSSGSAGRVLWCAPSYASGTKVQGVYWQDLKWNEPVFTGVWEGLWK